MPDARDLLSMILATAKLRGFDREQTAALQEVHDAMTCERCVLVRRGDGRGSLAGMADPALIPAATALLNEAKTKVQALADALEALAARTDIPTDARREIGECALTARAIGGPTDPT